MYTKLISILPPSKIITNPITFGKLINIIFPRPVKLIIPGANFCLPENRKRPTPLTFKEQRIPIRSNLFAIGDIHGSYEKLVRLIAKLNLTPKDIVIFLGDYIDRGNNSKEVIDFLLNLQTLTNCVFLGGNHEYALLNDIVGWLPQGGFDTLRSYGCPITYRNIQKIKITSELGIPRYILEPLWGKMMSMNLADDKETFISSEFHYRDLLQIVLAEKNFYGIKLADHIAESDKKRPIDVHSNFWPLLRDKAFTVGGFPKWGTDYHFSHEGINSDKLEDIPQLLGLRGTRGLLPLGFVDPRVQYIFGHTSRWEPEIFPGGVCIDTYAYKTGQLTAIEIPSRKFIFSN